MRLFRIIGLCCFLLTKLAICSAEEFSFAEQQVNKIKSSDKYYSAQSPGASEDEATLNAKRALCQKIYSSLSNMHTSINGKAKDEITSFTFGTLYNCETIVLKREPDAIVFVYIKKSDYNKGISDRENKVRSWIKTGIELEKRLDIGSALKYYNWAFNLISIDPNPCTIIIDNQPKEIKSWLESKIATVCNNIEVSIESVEERQDEAEKYVVNLRFNYCGNPISDLDFSYFNGLRKVDGRHTKNGLASIEYAELPKEKIELQYKYQYEDEGSMFDTDLAALYAAKSPYVCKEANKSFKAEGNKVKNFKIKNYLSKEEQILADKQAEIAPPDTEEARKTIQTNILDAKSSEQFIDKIIKVENAIRTKKYSSVKNLFTDSGYLRFMKMMAKGDISVVKQSVTEYKIEESGRFIVGEGIPVTIKYKGHSDNEKIVFRFNTEGQIQSLAYGLTQRAKDDIFRQNKWGLDVRYALLQFMEDYQTAYQIMDDKYIESIFAGDAIVIHGKINNSINRDFIGKDFYAARMDNSVTYTQTDKEGFLANLRRDFENKKYIDLKFEENEIRNAANSLDIDGIYWIQLKQFYSSNTYNDIGYLALMIDMREANPVIKVRTWCNYKFDLDKLITAYPVE